MGEAFYPKVRALLREGWPEQPRSPRRFDVSVKSLSSGNVGETRLRHVLLNADYLDQFSRDPVFLEHVLLHELTHVAQNYQRPIIGAWLVADSAPPAHWVEGIADYVCFKLGQSNKTHCAECNFLYPHFRNGYACAASFLLYVEQTYHTNVVPQLNAVLRRGKYHDSFFFHLTGKDLNTLWQEFQQTPAFTQRAAQMLELQRTLGFVDGKAPEDIEERLRKFMGRQEQSLADLIRGAEVTGLPKKNIQSRLTMMLYFMQPGATAEAFMVSLKERNELPGFSKGEHGTLKSVMRLEDLEPVYPVARDFTGSKPGQAATFHYSLLRRSAASGWEMQRAWRAHPDGSVAEEYSIQVRTPAE